MAGVPVRSIAGFEHIGRPSFDEPKQVQRAGDRCYMTPNGDVYPSVTTVTGHEKNLFFAEWRKNNPLEAARVASRGTILHSIVEHYVGNQWDGSCEPDEATAVENFRVAFDLFTRMKPLLDNHLDRIRAQEVGLYSDTLKLSGRTDCVADWDGVPSIVDFKGSTRSKRKADIDNYFTQCAAYALMWQERTGEAVPNVVVVLSAEDGMTNVFTERTMDWVLPLKKAIDNYAIIASRRS